MVISVQTTLVFSTFVFIVVIELSSKAGIEMILERIDIDDGPVWGLFPNLGIFTYIHVLSVFLLMSTYLVIFTNFITNDNIAITLVLLSTAAILVLLPFLELEDYDLIERSSDSLMDSKRTHYLFCVVVFVEPYIFIATNLIENFAGIEYANVGSVGIFLVSFFAAMIWFLNQIGDEVSRYVDSNKT